MRASGGFPLADRWKHCLYVALAEQERATLITADQQLLRKLQQPRAGLPVVMDLAKF